LVGVEQLAPAMVLVIPVQIAFLQQLQLLVAVQAVSKTVLA
jgi:hypothetical protein